MSHVVNRFDVYTLNGDSVQIENTPEGYVKITGAILTRTGVFKYSNSSEYRSPEEVFADSHLDSAEGKSITVGHPNAFVDSSNYKDYDVGTILKMYRKDNENYARGDLIVKDKKALGNSRELSLGYEVELIKQDGIDEGGNKYDYIQKNMKINHLAWVGKARAGSITRVNLDSAEYEQSFSPSNRFDSNQTRYLPNDNICNNMTDDMKKIQDENLELKAKLDAADKASTELQKKLDAADKASTELQKKLDLSSGENQGLKTQVESLGARLDGIEQQSKVNNVLYKVAELGIKLDAVDTDSPKDIMLKAIKASDSIKFDGIEAKSEEFIEGVFLALSKTAEKRIDSNAQVGKVISNYQSGSGDLIDNFNKGVIAQTTKQSV